jgi:hypothetical protein
MCRPNLKDKKGAVASQRSGLWRPSIWLFESSILPNCHIFKVKRFCKCDIIVQAHVGQIVHILVAYFIPAFVSLVHAWLANSMLDSSFWDNFQQLSTPWDWTWPQCLPELGPWSPGPKLWDLQSNIHVQNEVQFLLCLTVFSVKSTLEDVGDCIRSVQKKNILRRSMINGHCGSHVELLNLTVFTRNTKEPCPFNLATKQISTKVLV